MSRIKYISALAHQLRFWALMVFLVFISISICNNLKWTGSQWYWSIGRISVSVVFAFFYVWAIDKLSDVQKIQDTSGLLGAAAVTFFSMYMLSDLLSLWIPEQAVQWRNWLRGVVVFGVPAMYVITLIRFVKDRPARFL